MSENTTLLLHLSNTTRVATEAKKDVMPLPTFFRPDTAVNPLSEGWREMKNTIKEI